MGSNLFGRGCWALRCGSERSARQPPLSGSARPTAYCVLVDATGGAVPVALHDGHARYGRGVSGSMNETAPIVLRPTAAHRVYPSLASARFACDDQPGAGRDYGREEVAAGSPGCASARPLPGQNALGRSGARAKKDRAHHATTKTQNHVRRTCAHAVGNDQNCMIQIETTGSSLRLMNV